MFDEDMQAEMLEDMVAIGAANGAADSIVQSFDDCASGAFVEVVQEFLPPVLQSLGELYQLNQARSLGFVDPCAQEAFGLCAVFDCICDCDKAFLEQIGGA